VQTNCPNCSNRLVVDDAKVPPTPFMLKCPKCQNMVKLPGKGAPAAKPAAPAVASPPQGAEPAAQPSSPQPLPAPSVPAGRALVAFPLAEQAMAVSAVLTRLGFSVEHPDSSDDKVLRLQQGDFAVVAAPRNGVSEDKSLYRIVQTLPPEVRRRLFFILVADDVQSGEGTQAFALLADLVLNSKDTAQADRLLHQTLHERRRLYQTFWDTEDRKSEGRL
jgi:predicted Zn finger-like uncharacterized protein